MKDILGHNPTSKALKTLLDKHEKANQSSENKKVEKTLLDEIQTRQRQLRPAVWKG